MTAHVDDALSGEAMTHARRDAVLVLGAESPAVATFAGILRTLGMHAPTIATADDEPAPRWVADLHERLLTRANVAVDDGRPDAWFDAGRLSTQEQYRAKAQEWLGQSLAEHDDPGELVLADPALPWFLELWNGALSRLDADVAHVLVLAPPALAPHTGTGPTQLGRAVSWLNLTLHAERATRGTRRAAIRQADLLDDWTVPVYALGERWGLRSVMEARAQAVRSVHDFVDHAPRPAAGAEATLPRTVQELVHSTSAALDRLAEGKDDEALHRDFDELRAAFIDHYEQATDIAGASIRAVERRLRRAKERSPEKGSRDRTTPAAASPGGGSPRDILGKAVRAWRRLHN